MNGMRLLSMSNNNKRISTQFKWYLCIVLVAMLLCINKAALNAKTKTDCDVAGHAITLCKDNKKHDELCKYLSERERFVDVLCNCKNADQAKIILNSLSDQELLDLLLQSSSPYDSRMIYSIIVRCQNIEIVKLILNRLTIDKIYDMLYEDGCGYASPSEPYSKNLCEIIVKKLPADKLYKLLECHNKVNGWSTFTSLLCDYYPEKYEYLLDILPQEKIVALLWQKDKNNNASFNTICTYGKTHILKTAIKLLPSGKLHEFLGDTCSFGKLSISFIYLWRQEYDNVELITKSLTNEEFFALMQKKDQDGVPSFCQILANCVSNQVNNMKIKLLLDHVTKDQVYKLCAQKGRRGISSFTHIFTSCENNKTIELLTDILTKEQVKELLTTQESKNMTSFEFIKKNCKNNKRIELCKSYLGIK